jgi:ferredoxin
MGRIVRVWVEQQFCCAFGFCVDLCPEVFSLGEVDGLHKSTVLPDAPRHFIDKDSQIRAAVENCPVQCIHIEEEPAPPT